MCLFIVSHVGIIEPMKLGEESELVKRYKTQLELEADPELPVMSAATWLRGFEYWNPYNAKQLQNEDLDWSSK